jgi:nucleoside-diphosphate-sugar epimerase
VTDVLVTGATGFIGRHLVRRLLADGRTVRCLVRRSSDLAALPADRVELHYGDVTDPRTLVGAAKDVSVVYHLAAMGHVSAITESAYRLFHAVNVQGTENLVAECLRRRVGKFLHVSSTAAMGLIDGETADECTPPRPTTPYQRSKLQSEQVVLRQCRERQFPAVLVRPSMVFGPEGENTEFMKIVRLVARGRFPMFGRGTKYTPGVYVGDVVEGIVLAARRGRHGEVYILTAGEPFELDRMLWLIAEDLGVKRPGPRLPVWLMRAGAWGCEAASRLLSIRPPMTRQNVRSILADRRFSIRKAQEELGYEPRTDLASGVRQTLRWAVQSGALGR